MARSTDGLLTRALAWAFDALMRPAVALGGWIDRRREREWIAGLSRRLPVGSVARCRCGRCKGKRWVVWQYDYESNDVHVVSPEALTQHGGDYRKAWDAGNVNEGMAWIDPATLVPETPPEGTE